MSDKSNSLYHDTETSMCIFNRFNDEITVWPDGTAAKAVHLPPEQRYNLPSESSNDLSHPNDSFVKYAARLHSGRTWKLYHRFNFLLFTYCFQTISR